MRRRTSDRTGSSPAVVVALALVLVAGSAPGAAAESERKSSERVIRVGAIAAMIGIFVASETVAKDALAPDECRWCGVNDLDDSFRNAAVWDDTSRAKLLSDLIGYGGSSVGAATLLLLASADAGPGRWTAYGDDMIAVFEAVWGTQLWTQFVKILAGRQRPYAHYTPSGTLAQEDNLSFFSGHSSLTFSIAVSAGTVAYRRGYRLAPVILGGGLAMAATTAYLRMAADRHYFTDVLVGSAIGTLGGALFPRITGSLPARTTVVPAPGGVALIGQF
jgi:membrane-associated phospholipid phosphatase